MTKKANAEETAPFHEGGGQRLAALAANLVAPEKERLEPRHCPLLAVRVRS